MRKYKDIKRKEVVFDLNEWEKIENKAKKLSMKTTTYIRKMAVDGKVMQLENSDCREAISEMNRIGVNINQIARRLNETNSMYYDDVEYLKKEHDELCLMLNQYLSTLRLQEV